MDEKLMLGIPCGSGLFPHETVTALLQLKKTCPTLIQIVERQRTDKSRNYIVKQALEQGCTHLLFIDDDNPPPPDTIEKFLADDKDIVCAPIPSRNPNENGSYDLCIFSRRETEEGIPMYDHMNKVDTTGGHLIKVDGCGMGCTMIKRGVIETLYKKHEGEPFAYGDSTLVYDAKKMNQQRRTMSEDMEFIERATNEGFEVWCDTRIRPPHIGSPKIIKFSDNYLV